MAEMTASAKRDTLLLIDANGLVYRAFYALPYFTTRDGRPTNAVYGFTTMLLKVLDEIDPQCVAVAFDKPGPTFRHEAFAEYKATRRKMPDDLGPQIPLAKEVVEAFELPIFEIAGFEADDVIGTLARLAEARGMDVVIVTTMYDEAGVRVKLGVEPAQVPDFKSLKGDTTDNIPGVPGVGDKTAARLLAGGATVEDVLQTAGDGREARLRQKLEDHREQILQSKALSTIDTRVPLSVSWDLLTRRPADAARVRALFTRLEFRSLLDRLGVEEERHPEARGTYRKIVPDELAAFLRGATQIAIAPMVGNEPAAPGLAGLALAARPGEACYVDLAGGIPAGLARVIEDAGTPKLSQDVKRDQILLERAGLAPRGFAFDVGLASYLLDSGKRAHTLESAAWEHLRWRLHQREHTADGLALGPPPGEVAAEEADLIVRLRDVMEAQLRAREVDRLYREVELPLAGVLARMERTGVAIDVPALRALSDEIYRLAGTEFNIGSPKQLAFVLFEKLQLPALKRTKTGYSTDAEVLER